MSSKSFAVYSLFAAAVLALGNAGAAALPSSCSSKNTNSFAGALPVAPGNGVAQGQRDLPLTEEINKTYQLAHGARVEVAGIAGPVEVIVVEGDTATVQVVRSAQTREDLDCYRTVVEGDANRVEIRHEQFVRRGRCESIKAQQRVRLSVPRHVDLHLSTIAGGVIVGAVEGVVRLTNIAGHVAVSGAQSVEMSSLASGLTMRIDRVSARGMRIEGVAGAVELRVGESLDADVVVDDILGKLVAETPRAQVSKVSDTKYRVKVGAGGAEISVTGVTGDVRLRRG
jgi:hypothetical protein